MLFMYVFFPSETWALIGMKYRNFWDVLEFFTGEFKFPSRICSSCNIKNNRSLNSGVLGKFPTWNLHHHAKTASLLIHFYTIPFQGAQITNGSIPLCLSSSEYLRRLSCRFFWGNAVWRASWALRKFSPAFLRTSNRSRTQAR